MDPVRDERADGRRLPLVVVDAANVVGSVPDGWWRDRAAAAARLRDALAEFAAQGLPPGTGPDWARGPMEVVLVVEGAARSVTGTTAVRVIAAPASGDDAIVEFVRGHCDGRRCLVVTADRQLRERVRDLGAQVIGPSALRPRTKDQRRRGGGCRPQRT